MEEPSPNSVGISDDESADFSYRLAQAIERSSELIGMADQEGNFVFGNQAFYRMMGYSKEEIVGRHFSSLISPANSAALLQEFTARMYEPSGWQGDCLIRRRDGADLLVSLSVGQSKTGKAA